MTLCCLRVGLGLAWLLGLSPDFLQAESVTLRARSRERIQAESTETRVLEKELRWDAARTAVVVCDMWDRHHCPDATTRVGEMAPRMDRVLAAARRLGMLIIHCPSDTMEFYKDHPGRRLAQQAPKVETKVPLQGWCSLNGVKEPPLPIDDSDGGCDGCPECPGYRAWSRQHPGLRIEDGDAITDSVEAFYLMRQRGITNVIVMGVHVNMCVLGRPFAIRQMVAQGQNVVLMRDMTDSMYHHRKAPYVSHVRGTEMVVEHIEQYWCPSITSVDFIGGEPFRFQEDRRQRIAMVIAENEYQTEQTLPAFAKRDLVWRGFDVDYVMGSPKEGDPEFRNIEALRQADLVVVSVRRRTPSKAMLDLLRAHVAAGKPVVGLRTASHAFDAKTAGEGYAAWTGFDREVLGGAYKGHYGNKPPAGAHTVVRRASDASGHFGLRGVEPAEFRVTSHLYKYAEMGPETVVLLRGVVEGTDQPEPVAWVNTAGDRRAFYTSLGNAEDFQLTAFRRLLLNGILWCLHQPIPPAEYKMASLAGGGQPEAPRPAATAAPAPAPAASVSATTYQALDLPQDARADALSPVEAARRFKVADDLEWEQVLSEPEIRQPVFLNFDERGRMWVVEFRQYPMPAGLKMLSRDSVWRAVYDKVPPPPPRHFKGADRISIHEDGDGDGTFEKHKIFVDGLNIVTAVERGRGGVWVLNPPYLLFYPEANGDDVPDRDPEVRLSGFGLEDTHSVVNSLRWGPDGWLYGAQGSTVTANVLVHGPDGVPLHPKPVYSQGQNIWRYHPEKRLYEVFAEGGGNAFGCEIDSEGRIFSGHNGGDTRGFHYVQGGYLQKGFEKHGPLSNPYAFGYFPPMAHDRVPRFTHNFVIYDHGSFPSRYQGKLFGVEPIQGRIVESELTPVGSTFRTRDLSRPVVSEDRWFRPVDIKGGPDGALYVCDWYDQQVNHFRNHEGRIDVSNGRIYRLKAKGAVARKPLNLGALSTRELVEKLSDANRWVRQTSLRLLADREASQVNAELTRSEAEGRGKRVLETLWARHQAGGLTPGQAAAWLDHPDAQARWWTVRLLGDGRMLSDELSARLTSLAQTDPSLDVRVQLASTAKRLPARQGLTLAKALAQRSEDVKDPRQPLMIWWAIEGQAGAHQEDIVRLFEEASFWSHPLVETHLLDRVMRRFAQSGTRRDWEAATRLFELSPGPSHSRKLMSGFEAAFKGRTLGGLPEALTRAMSRHATGTTPFGLRQGDAQAVRKALRVVADETASREERLEYLGVMSEIKVAGAVPALSRAYRGVYKDDALRKAILAALRNYEDPAVADVVLEAYSALGKESLASAQTLLASRPVWSRKLMLAIQKQPQSSWPGPALKRESIPPGIVRKLREHRDPELKAMVEKSWPGGGVTGNAELEARIRRLEGVIREGMGDPYEGRTLFQNTCAGCHRLFGQGAEAGPDLTAHPRADIESMLLAVINPSAEIREGYENYAVETKDGRSLSGFLVEQDGRIITLRGLDAQNVTLAREDLSEFRAAGMSLMPEGLLDGMTDQQVRDLFGYLRSTQPLVGEPPKRTGQK